MPEKTRIAPTPSGYLHLGNVFSFVLTAAIAEKAGAGILLRIDGLDAQREKPEFVQDIFDTLNFLDIPWTDGPRDAVQYYHQYSPQLRMPLYHEALRQLVAGGNVFACTCSRSRVAKDNPDGSYPGTCINKQLPLDTPGACWRLRTPVDAHASIKDPGGCIDYLLPPDMHHLVVRKKDGCPAYQVSSLIDDLHFGTSIIVRGLDLLPSTIAQHYLAKELGHTQFSNIICYHHSLLVDENGGKLSKSDGATSVQYLRKTGYNPEDIFRLIGSTLGIPGNINTWQALAANCNALIA